MNRNQLIIGGSIGVIIILAAAAFVGVRLLNTPAEAEAQSPGGGGRVMEIINDDGSGPVALRLSFEPAPELPARPAEIGGVFVRREDNSLIVGTGEITLDVEVDGATGEETISTGHNGPEVEVVVSRDTLIYRDTTEIEVEPSARQSGETTVQQTVEPVDSLAEIGENMEIQAWGDQRGDRLVAEVLVYRQPR